VPFNSTVFGAYFVSGAIYSGVAAIILLMVVLRRLLHLEEFITRTQFLYLGYLLAAFSLIMIYFNLSEYITHGYKMESGVPFQFDQLMLGRFAVLFWFYILGGLFLPGLIILFPKTRTINGIVFGAVLVIIAMWVERYLIVVSGFRVPLLAYSPANYAPTWVEWSILAGAFALFMFIISVFAKLIPVVSVWEVVEHRGPEPGAIARNPVGSLMPLPVSGGEA
jgi:Ni/Fe-hydrogenase subunit HybB-like protein